MGSPGFSSSSRAMRLFFVLYTTFDLATAVNFAARDVDDAVGSGGVFAIDVDGDGDVDVLSASYFQDTIAWYENDGSESFAGHDLTNSSGGAWSVHAIDVDGDGDVDVLSASFADDTVAWYENDGLESFVEHVVTTLADGAMSAYPIDLDGDGDVDVLYASSGDDTVAACKNDGSEISRRQHELTSSPRRSPPRARGYRQVCARGVACMQSISGRA